MTTDFAFHAGHDDELQGIIEDAGGIVQFAASRVRRAKSVSDLETIFSFIWPDQMEKGETTNGTDTGTDSRNDSSGRGLEAGRVRAADPDTDRGTAGGTVREGRNGGVVAVGEAIGIVHSEGEDKGRYEVWEAADLVPSHDANNGFTKREEYPEGVQERPYHSDQGEQLKVRMNAARLDPRFLLTDNPDAVNGPPIVTEKGLVLGGNSRTMSLQYAFENTPEKTTRYVEILKAKAANFGIAPETIDRFKRPVLVRVVTGGEKPKEEMAKLVRVYNQSFTQGINAKAEGVSRARLVTDESMGIVSQALDGFDSIRDYLASPQSKSLINALVADGVLENTQLSRLTVKETGLLNDEGKRLVENVLRGKALDDFDLLEALPPAIQAKIDKVLSPLARVKARGGEWDITDKLKKALWQHVKFSQSGSETMETFWNQISMFDADNADKADPRVTALFYLMGKGKPNEIAEAWKVYAKQAAANPKGQMGLPGMAVATPEGTFGKAFKPVLESSPPVFDGFYPWENLPIAIEGIRNSKDFNTLAAWFCRVTGEDTDKFARKRAEYDNVLKAFEVIKTGTDLFLRLSAIQVMSKAAWDSDVEAMAAADGIHTKQVYQENKYAVSPGDLKSVLDSKGKPVFDKVKDKLGAIDAAKFEIELFKEGRKEDHKTIIAKSEEFMGEAKELAEVEVKIHRCRDILKETPNDLTWELEEMALMERRDELAKIVNKEFVAWVTEHTKALDAEEQATSKRLSDARDAVHQEVLGQLLDASSVTQSQAEGWVEKNVFVDESSKGKLRRLKYPLKDFYRDAAEFYRLTGGNVGAIQFVITRGRSNATREAVQIGQDFDKRTLFHELSHTLDALEPGFVKAAQAFIKGRAKGEPEWLGKLTGNKKYKRHEVAYPDDFIHPYVGKVYDDASEVMSMGLECLANPNACEELIRKDPEHFQLVMGAALQRNPLKQVAIEKSTEKSVQTKERLSLEDVWKKELAKATKGLSALLEARSELGYQKGFHNYYLSIRGGARASLWVSSGELAQSWAHVLTRTKKDCTNLAYFLICYELGLLKDYIGVGLIDDKQFLPYAVGWAINGTIIAGFDTESTLPKIPLE